MHCQGTTGRFVGSGWSDAVHCVSSVPVAALSLFGVVAALAAILLVGSASGCAVTGADQGGAAGADLRAPVEFTAGVKVARGNEVGLDRGVPIFSDVPPGVDRGAAGRESGRAPGEEPAAVERTAAGARGAGPDMKDLCWHDGDVDDNGRLTAGDAQLAWRIALGQYEPTAAQQCAADCNGDGNVTADDVRDIFGRLLGLPTCPHHLPCGESCTADADCGCGQCIDHVCTVPPDPCGDGVCDEAAGETCETCPADCGECGGEAGLIVWYPFDDDFVSAGVVRDASGNGHDAMVYGTVAEAGGVTGQAIRFNGGYGNYAQAATNPAGGRTQVTFSLWFKTPNPAANIKLVAAAWWYGGLNASGFIVGTHYPEMWADGQRPFWAEEVVHHENHFLAGAWNHQVVTYDGQFLREYTNGALINEWRTNGHPVGMGSPLAVGAWPQYGFPMYGEIDDFRMYDHAKSEADVLAMYCADCPGECPGCPPPDPCGDGVCAADAGETCDTCPADCGECAGRQCLLLSQCTRGTINRYDIETEAFDILRDSINTPNDLAVDPATGAIYFTTWPTGSCGQVRRLNADGTIDSLYDLNCGGQGIALDIAERRIYWGEYYSGLFVGSMDGAAVMPRTLLVSSQQLRDALGAPTINGVGGGVEFDPAERQIYFFSRDNHDLSHGTAVWRVNADGTDLTVVHRSLHNADCMGIDFANGNIYFVKWLEGTNRMWRFGLDGSNATELFTMPDNRVCTSIAPDAATDVLYVTGYPPTAPNVNSLFRIRLDGSELEWLATDLLGAGGLLLLDETNDGGLCGPPDPCGDGVCDEAAGETCETCPADCGECPSGCFDPSQDPVPLCSCEDLQRMQEDPTRHYALQDDIDCAETASWNWSETAGLYQGFAPIANFTGRLSGADHVISNLSIRRPSESRVALFADLGGDAELHALRIENAFVQGRSNVGIVAGYSRGGMVDAPDLLNVQVSGEVRGDSQVGGLIGESYNGGILYRCSADVAVTGRDATGGLVGSMWDGHVNMVLESYTTGSVTGQTQTGGLVGYCKSSWFEDVYSTAAVTGTHNVGGFVGYYNETMLVEEAYFAGSVSGESNVGGLFGYVNPYTGAYSYLFHVFVVGPVSATTGDAWAIVAEWYPTASTFLGYLLWDPALVGTTACAPSHADACIAVPGAELQGTTGPTTWLSWWNFETVWQANEADWPTLRW